jgi:hypothetical protein
MAKVTVDSGICGFRTVIDLRSEDMQHASVRIETDCPNLKPLEAQPFEVDGYVECFSKLGESTVFEKLRPHCRHPGCPVPSGIIKGIEVACGLALPKDASIHIVRDEN